MLPCCDDAHCWSPLVVMLLTPCPCMGPTSCVSCMGMALNGGNKNAETLSHDPLHSPPTARPPWPTAHQTLAPRASVAHAAGEPGFGAGVQDRGCWGSGCATEPKGRRTGEAASQQWRRVPGGGAEVAGAAEPGGGGRPVGGGGGGIRRSRGWRRPRGRQLCKG